MADIIDTIPALITSVDTSEHEIQFNHGLFGDGPIELQIEVTTGSIQFSKGKAISNGSATYAAASNNKLIMKIKHGKQSIFYKATASGDKFTISE